jgi:SAM-dependent methyltransferase
MSDSESLPYGGSVRDHGSILDRQAEKFGQSILKWRFVPPVQYWAKRVWDGDRAEISAGLGEAYVKERLLVVGLLSEHLTEAQPLSLCAADVACGTGRYTRALLDLGVTHATCFDVSSRSLENLKGRLERQAPVETVLCDVMSSAMDAWNEHFDIVLCCDAIHHLGDLPAVLLRLAGLVKPGGVLVGDVWISDSYGDLQARRSPRPARIASAAKFALAAAINAITGRPLITSARSQLRSARDTASVIQRLFPRATVLPQRYWVTFSTVVGAREGIAG